MMAVGNDPFELVRFADGDGWQKVSSQTGVPSPHVEIETAQYLTPTRREQPVTWAIVHRKAAVAIAPMLPDGRFILLSQERIPVHRTLWEFPAGQIDVPVPEVTHELVNRTALTELREEVGAELIEGGTLQSLGYFFPSQGFTQEHVYLFLAKPVRIVAKPAPMGGEHFGGLRYVTLEELRQMIASNEITTALTLALYAKISALALA